MNLLLLGAPGSGKGTLANFIIPSLKLTSISTGDLLRQAVKAGSALGKQAEALMKKGEFVSDEIVMGLVSDGLKTLPTAGYILDGFPRNAKQAQMFDAHFKNEPKFQIEHVVYLKVDLDTVLMRLTGRRLCPQCGTIYQLRNHPPKKDGICDKDGAKLITRADDEPATIQHRFEVFLKETLPLVEYYEKQGKLDTIRGEVSDVESYADFKQCLEQWKALA